ncbi:DM13 domain-containing protein [Shewanella sp. Scap07]|uniref:DM13 domain-containing protein n=1 Tax=Shewanella sp. Scap07 TaxID=2589987 RepID=UPI0015BFC975|nr:DM13 domain-containing protein [Shewanella sp. Scap07]QLE85175.1 DM13 domain-containing protein [Shewanella sp. Scap07]
MKPIVVVLLLISHAIIAMMGFAAGIYALPILTAPEAPKDQVIQQLASDVRFEAELRRDLVDSDMLHWGEGRIVIGAESISLLGSLAPGPDYRLYLSPEFVETEADFKRLKSTMVNVGPVKTFSNFIVPIADNIEPADYTSVIIWCESFGEFISAARYQ